MVGFGWGIVVCFLSEIYWFFGFWRFKNIFIIWIRILFVGLMELSVLYMCFFFSLCVVQYCSVYLVGSWVVGVVYEEWRFFFEGW